MKKSDNGGERISLTAWIGRHRWKFVFGLAAVGLGFFAFSCIWMNLRLVEMGNRMSYLQDTSDVIQTDVGTLQTNLEKTLRKENSALEDYSMEVSSVDLKTGTYKLEVSAVPKEYTEKTRLTIYFGTKDYAMKRKGFHYTADVTLPLSESYDGNVTVLITNGEKKNTEILKDYEGYPTVLGGTLEGTLTGDAPVYEKGILRYRGAAEFSLTAQELDGFREFENLFLVVRAGGRTLQRTQLITEELLGENADGFLREQTEAQTQTEAVTQQLEEATQEPEVEAAAGVVNSWKGSVALELKEELVPQTEVRILLEAESTEGYILTRELFKGLTAGEGERQGIQSLGAKGVLVSDGTFARRLTGDP